MSVHAIVDRVDSRQDRPGLLVGAEAEVEHRVEGVEEAPQPAPVVDMERAVVGDTLGHERVSELQEDGRAPGDEQDDLPLEFPANRTEPRTRVRWGNEGPNDT